MVLHVHSHLSASRMVEEAMEVAVSNAQNAIGIYTWGLGAAPAAGPSATQGWGAWLMPQAGIPGPGTTQCCSLQPLPRACSLFTLTVEQQLEGGRHQRSALRILASSGACPELYVWELQPGLVLPSHTLLHAPIPLAGVSRQGSPPRAPSTKHGGPALDRGAAAGGEQPHLPAAVHDAAR